MTAGKLIRNAEVNLNILSKHSGLPKAARHLLLPLLKSAGGCRRFSRSSVRGASRRETTQLVMLFQIILCVVLWTKGNEVIFKSARNVLSLCSELFSSLIRISVIHLSPFKIQWCQGHYNYVCMCQLIPQKLDKSPSFAPRVDFRFHTVPSETFAPRNLPFVMSQRSDICCFSQASLLVGS